MLKKSFEEIPKRKLSDVEKQVIAIKLEQIKLDRDKAVLVLNKGVLIYFAFVILAILGFTNGYLDRNWLNWIVFLGVVVLIIAIVPYSIIMNKEEKELKKMLEELTRI